MEWDLHITYDVKPYTLKAKVEYESAQIMRIRVQGNHSTILLETNYPIVALSKGKAITWKIREGKFDMANKKSAKLFMDIITYLEHYLKGNDYGETHVKYLQRTKH